MIYDDLWFPSGNWKKNMVIYAGLASINHPSPGPLADLRCQPWGSTAAASRCCWIAWCSDGLPTPTALGWAMASRPSLGRWLGVERFKHLYRTHHYIDYTYVYIYMNIYIYMDIDFDIDIDHIDDLRLKSYKITSNRRNCLSDFFRFLWAQGYWDLRRSTPWSRWNCCIWDLRDGWILGGCWDWIISLPALFQIEKCSFWRKTLW